MNSLIADIVKDLCIELDVQPYSNDYKTLEIKVKNAYAEVKSARRYRGYHKAEFIEVDMQDYRSNIHDLALYDFNQIGAEGQTSHNENSISRTWKTRESCFKGISPFVHTVF